MGDSVEISSRRVGRTHHARIAAAKAQHQEAISKHRRLLLDSDIAFEPKNFAEWIRKCDSYRTRVEIENLIQFMKPALEAARLSRDHSPRSALYVAIRTPYLEYAEQALDRRFPEAAPTPATDPQPYERGERGERGYVAHVAGSAK